MQRKRVVEEQKTEADKLRVSSPGSRLRKLREAKGLTLEAASEQTHVRVCYLKALETEQIDSLLGPAYAISFLKAYGRLLEADEILLDDYRDLISRTRDSLSELKPRENDHRDAGSRLAIILLIASVAVLGAIWILSGGTAGPGDEEFSPVVEIAPEAPPKSSIAEPAIIMDAGQSLLTLQILAAETTWVSVASDGAEKPALLLAPGDIRLFDAKKDFRVTLGNAGGVELSLNGHLLPPLGKRGHVVRDVIIDRKQIPAGSPKGFARE